MSLHRYTRPVDGTIPVPALLYDDEDNLSSQEGVGIYEGYVPFRFSSVFPAASRISVS